MSKQGLWWCHPCKWKHLDIVVVFCRQFGNISFILRETVLLSQLREVYQNLQKVSVFPCILYAFIFPQSLVWHPLMLSTRPYFLLNSWKYWPNIDGFPAGLCLLDGPLLSCTRRRTRGLHLMKGILMQLGVMVLVYFGSSPPPALEVALTWRQMNALLGILSGHFLIVGSPFNSHFNLFVATTPLPLWLISLMPLSTFSVPSACCMLLRARTTTRIMKWMILIRAEQLWPTGERSSAHSPSATPPYSAPLVSCLQQSSRLLSKID